MTARVRRAGGLAAVTAVVAGIVAVAGGVRLSAAAALLARGHRAAPYALVRRCGPTSAWRRAQARCVYRPTPASVPATP
jgi:hypothetical protein